jgi:hypothetical protein
MSMMDEVYTPAWHFRRVGEGDGSRFFKWNICEKLALGPSQTFAER